MNCTIFVFYIILDLISLGRLRLCSNGARSPEATNIWPRATENILAGRPAHVGFLIYSQKAKRKCCSIGGALIFKGRST